MPIDQTAPLALELLPEETLRSAVDTCVRFVEAGGAIVILVGAVLAFVRFVIAGLRRDRHAFVPVRLTLGRFLALGLEFQLASDVLRTAIAPSFEELGKLAAVAAIRTALNYFLGKEIREEKEQVEAEHAVTARATGDTSAAASAASHDDAAAPPAAGTIAGSSDGAGAHASTDEVDIRRDGATGPHRR